MKRHTYSHTDKSHKNKSTYKQKSDKINITSKNSNEFVSV